MELEQSKEKIFIIGAGPAGLTAGYKLAQEDYGVTIAEGDPIYVGGISKTVEYKGFHFDIGGHRFFSKSKEVEDFWTEILPDDMLERPRSSRIFYRGKFYSYPLRAFEALRNLGVFESLLCVLSYIRYRIFPIQNPVNFEDWVTNQFGARLFRIFFKTYTEKVWGMSCKEISADWAAQRIKGLSLGKAIFNALFRSSSKRSDQKNVIKTLIDSFRYPKKGPGMLWNACRDKIKAMKGEILMATQVTGLKFENSKWTAQVTSPQGVKEYSADHVISSAPIRELISFLSPAPPPDVLKAANSLKYRDFLTVTLMVKGSDIFSDNWIYIHDPNVKVGRIQNFKSWSPHMVPSSEWACYGLEYFCFEGDGLWNMKDEDLIKLAKKEMTYLGLCNPESVQDGHVVRQLKAYPVYDDIYKSHVELIKKSLDEHYPNLHLVGRNGMHKYNNQDHAMMTAMLAVENIKLGKQAYDLWSVNEDAEYHEEGKSGNESTLKASIGLRSVPERIQTTSNVST